MRVLRATTVLLLLSLSASQVAAQGRRAVSHGTITEAPRRAMAGTSARLRFGHYVLSRFEGSAATRQWPLMTSRTMLHRYQFAVQTGETIAWDARCQLITISGDAARDRTRLACSLSDRSDDGDEWQLDLDGRYELDGELSGPSHRFRIVHADSAALRAVDGSDAAGYFVFEGDVLVARVAMQGRGRIWIEPGIGEREGGAIAAALFALLLRRDLGRAAA